MKKVYVADFTLKALAEERTLPLLFREKLAVARSLDGLGVDAVELAPVKNVKEDRIICKTMASSLDGCKLCMPVGLSSEGVDAAWECIKTAKNPCLQVELPVSAVQMEYICGIKKQALDQKITELVSYAKEKCCDVEFVAADAARADRAVLLSAVNAAVKAGASAVTVCDDEGLCLPGDIADLVKATGAEVNVPVYLRISDQIGLAVAGALAGLAAGASGVKCSVCGSKSLNTAALGTALAAKSEILGFNSDLRTTEIQRDIDSLLKKITHTDYLSTGADAASGDVFLDASSTITDVGAAVRSLGYDLSDEDTGKVHDALMLICSRKSSVGAKELDAIVASSAMQAPSTYHLSSFNISTSNSTSMANVVLVRDNGDVLSGVATGDGPIDCAFRAIEKSKGFHYELDDFQIQAVTEGKESLGSTLVKLRSGGRLYSGNGLSADIVAASIRAYINALNKIVFEESRS